MALADYEFRGGLGYFLRADQSGPYWLDDSGVGTLMSTSKPAVTGAATNPAYAYWDGAGWVKASTGAGPYASS